MFVASVEWFTLIRDSIPSLFSRVWRLQAAARTGKAGKKPESEWAYSVKKTTPRHHHENQYRSHRPHHYCNHCEKSCPLTHFFRACHSFIHTGSILGRYIVITSTLKSAHKLDELMKRRRGPMMMVVVLFVILKAEEWKWIFFILPSSIPHPALLKCPQSDSWLDREEEEEYEVITTRVGGNLNFRRQ